MQDIIKLKKLYNDVTNVYICGCGEGLVNYNKDKLLPDRLVIAINFAVCITDKTTDLLFTDSINTLAMIDKKYDLKRNHNIKIVLPLYSHNKWNFDSNNKIYNIYKNNIYFYVWSYLNDRIINKDIPIYPLDEIMLYIGWGTSNSAIHFASRLPKLDKIYIYGCRGDKPNHPDYLKWQQLNEIQLNRRKKQYLQSRKYQDIILNNLNLNYEYF